MYTVNISSITCVSTYCETLTNVSKRLIPVHRLIKVIKVLLSWGSLTILFHLKKTAAIPPGYTTPPLSLQSFTGAVSASHNDYMTKFGGAGI